jgi:serine protease
MLSGKLAAAGSLFAALVLSVSSQADTKRYLVQFKSPATFRSVSRNIQANMIMAPGVMAPMHLFNSSAVVAKSLDHVQLLVIESDDAAAVESLKQHPAVAVVEEEMMHPAPKVISTFGNQSVLRNKKHQKLNFDMPWGIGAVKATEAWATTKGGGARVMVLDTGLDTGHPAIASRFEKGQNFTGGDANDITDNVGHGTHVSGTISADGANGGLVGVAPEVKLLMGKVCEQVGCSSVAIASGIDWAVAEKADVVNMSLGGSFLSDLEAQALDKAEQAGVLIVAASGNDGTDTVGYPAAVPTVVAVGAVDSTLKKADFSQWGPELAVVGPGVDVVSSVPRGTGRGSSVNVDDSTGMKEVKSLPFQGSPVAQSLNNDVVFANLGKPEDFQSIDVKGKIALIQRGDIPFKEKLANALAAGAVGMIVYNNAPGLIQGSLTDDGSEVSVPAAMIEQAAGETLKDSLNKSLPVKASLDVIRTDYASFQGTSMATPHVAGVAALVRAVNHNLTPAQVKDILKSTATALGPNDQNQYGSGIVNAEAAVAKAAATNFVGVRQAAN